jgi:hypothetical protein
VLVGKNYIFVDYENVQPADLAALHGYDVQVIVFLGQNQAKLSSRFAASLQALGSSGTYVHIDGNGHNALDFHVAFYLGELVREDPDGFFHIISKDKGFDPLVRHLRGRRVRAHRVDDLSRLPFLGATDSSSREERVEEIVRNLHSRGMARPRKRKTLLSTIHSHFLKKLEESEVNGLLEELIRRGYVAIEGEAVSYRQPISRG